MKRSNSNTKIWDNLADLYNKVFSDIHLYDETYDSFLEMLKQDNASILELGCGPGTITSYLLEKKPKLQIVGTDASPRMIEIAKNNMSNVLFRVMDCRDLKELDTKFDGIICGFCIPYISVEECEKLLQDSFDRLNADGVLYLSFIEGIPEKSGYEKDSNGANEMYVNYYLAKKMKLNLMKLGYESCKLFQRNYTRRNGIEEIHSIVLAKK